MVNNVLPERARAWVLALLVAAPSWQPAFPEQNGGQTTAQRAAFLMQVEQGVAPLLILGDVNEDGHVDATDAALIRQLAAGESPAAATCAAAADFNMDGKIDSADVEVMRRILALGPVTIPALSFQYRLPCGFKNLLLAARPDVGVGEANLVYFVDARFTTNNSKVEITKGNAATTAMSSGKGYVIARSSPDTKPSTVTLLITLGNNSSRARFYYTYRDGSTTPPR